MAIAPEGMGRTRWTDDRLDDRFHDLISGIQAQREIPKTVAELTIRMEESRHDINSAFQLVHDLGQKIDRQIETLGKKIDKQVEVLINKMDRRIDAEDVRREVERTERKSDRRFYIATMMTCAALIISGVAIIQGFG